MSNGSVPNIALRAYQLWDAAGRPEGRDEEFYFQAEEELRKLLEIEGPNESGEKRTTPMADAIATPETEDETGKQIPPRRHDAGSGANETEDGLDASPEALGHAAEVLPSAVKPDEVEAVPVFDRADLPPKSRVYANGEKEMGRLH